MCKVVLLQQDSYFLLLDFNGENVWRRQPFFVLSLFLHHGKNNGNFLLSNAFITASQQIKTVAAGT
jgi:hypothetical protein